MKDAPTKSKTEASVAGMGQRSQFASVTDVPIKYTAEASAEGTVPRIEKFAVKRDAPTLS